MKKVWAAAGLLFLSAPLLAEPVDGGLKYKKECAGCHGRQADKKAFDKAPPLISLSQDELASALTARRDGKVEGAGNRAKAHLSDEDIKALAAYIATLKK
ncbi:c-type cytochrome [Affinibrenneria salicis]|uniref:C-type cytochrome n=1 Tax=Affinibrenneria salicis TaxID=2590031 RepID=A0A5J5G1E6_9GAMM|nr:c-type cytochrome [Affinibrenneria salicis]KAA9000481.1 c-type cytochrome [Affinibrenneria salicis]